MSRRSAGSLWDVLCPYRNTLHGLFVLGILLFVLNLVPLLAIDALTPGTRQILWVNGALTFGLVVGSGYVLTRCARVGNRA